MRSPRAPIWILTIGILFTSLVCSLLPVPPQLAPTTEPIIITVNYGLTEAARPTATPTETLTPTPTLTLTPTATPLPPTATPVLPGGITGSLGYPSLPVPPLRIVAIRIADNYYKSMDVPQNTPAYQMNGLTPGKYVVIAYLITPGKNDPTYGGGYTKAVVCGLTPSCTDHTLAEVEIKGGQVSRNINPVDWYAPKGTFPKNPTIH